MSWLGNLVAGSDTEVDTVGVAGLTITVTFCAVILIGTWRDHRDISPVSIGAGAVALLGAIGGAKTARDRWSTSPPPAPPPPEPGPGAS